MSDLADRLRADADQLNIEFGECSAADSMREAAGELDRLGLIVGKAAAYTDVNWAAEIAAADRAAGPLFPSALACALFRELSQADEALSAAQGYWERHLQETGGR